MTIVTCDFVLDPELFAFKFENSQIIGVRPLVLLLNCVIDSRMFAEQRGDTLIRCHSDLQ